jgi:6-phosphogluconolactonase
MDSVEGRELRLVADVPAAFVEVVQAAFAAAEGTFRLALSGGETARACYEALAVAGGIDWSRVECFLGDERCVPPEDDDANQKMVRAALTDLVRPAGFYPMDCGDPAGYERLLERAGALDLVHLGLGPDGHTASLFPASAGLAAPASALVVRNVDESGRNKHPRLSFTLGQIARSRLAVFTVSGSSKAKALAAVLAGEDLPAGRVRAGRVLFLCDEEAMSEVGR